MSAMSERFNNRTLLRMLCRTDESAEIIADRIEQLERENAALREDRARLDYLTQSLGWIVVGWPEMDPSDYATEEGTLTDFWIAAIDAARAKEGQP